MNDPFIIAVIAFLAGLLTGIIFAFPTKRKNRYDN
jgi:hypothetical protein